MGPVDEGLTDPLDRRKSAHFPLNCPIHLFRIPGVPGPDRPPPQRKRDQVRGHYQPPVCGMMTIMFNYSVEVNFLLMQFSDSKQLQIVHGFLFLLIYLEALMGNLLIFILVTMDRCLHTPMYFFLKNLSCLDAGLISVTVPNLILNSLTHRSLISFPGCVCQVLLVIHFVGSELFLLTTMSYDRYVAICHPLHYDVIMNKGICMQMVATSWIFGSIFGVLYSAGTFSLSFCGSRKVPQFFCDVPSLLKISCSEKHVTIDVSVTIGVIWGLFCLVGIGISYAYIFSTVLRMPSFQGRSKAFSTCMPHLIVVTTFLVTGATAYLKPVPDSPHLIDFLVSVFYSVMPPSLNPIIYSLRNKEIKASLWKLLWKLHHYKCYE
ncbi:olfactory receptor 14A2-like [Dipodomys spectabilis]|uniref:olfactory receptor 14A2-like n=1 Tax=Dipodomys spectabilis TaxID=105255 RepID=UPI001C53A669|nr:olfactory receptor 14A2-like [Dipodomys spectabilis]